MIDIKNQAAIRKLTLEDLYDDAIERKDRVAMDWLDAQALLEVERKTKSGEVVMVSKPIISVRMEYLKKFLGYTTPAKSSYDREKAKLDRINKRKHMIAEKRIAFNNFAD